MSETRLWSAYQLAWEHFEADPSLKNEAAVVATYAEWCRAFCPENADNLITLLHRRIADAADRRGEADDRRRARG
jgi:hypothetical protein